MKINGHRLRELREKAGKSRAELAAHIDCTEQNVYVVEGKESATMNTHVAKACVKFLRGKIEDVI